MSQHLMDNSTARTDKQLYFRLLNYVKPYWLVFMLAAAALMIFSAMNTLFIDLFKVLLDYLQNATGQEAELTGEMTALSSDDGKSILREKILGEGLYQQIIADGRIAIPLLFIAIALVRGISFLAGTYGMAYISSKLMHNLRTDLFGKMTRLPATYFDRNMGGHMITKLTYQVTQVSDSMVGAVKTVVAEGSQVIYLVGALLFYSWKLTLVFMAVIPIIALVVVIVGRSFRQISQRIQNAMGDVTQISQELVNGYKVMRLFGGEAHERERMNESSLRNRKQIVKMGLVQGISSPFIQLLISMAMALLIYWAIEPDFIQELTVSTLITFLMAAGALTRPVRKLTSVMEPVQRALAAGQSIFETMDAEEEQDNGTHKLQNVDGEFRFENVCFAYNTEDGSVLTDVSFDVAAGESIALVGSSGSGKSTLVNLIPRFYNHTSGQVLVDGMDINDCLLADLRSHISFVNQQVTLFNDTVYNNIAYGQLAQLPREKVIEAARAANALDFIEGLPKGWDTVIGDDGSMLSGGQRQRLVIARALLKDSPILILDEATSALDTESERHIQLALERLMKDRTTFVIAHRLSTIENADRILVMEKGRIVEQGNHQQLLATDGRYAQLYQRGFDSQ